MSPETGQLASLIQSLSSPVSLSAPRWTLADGTVLTIGSEGSCSAAVTGPVSRSRVGVHHASIIGTAGRLGIDIEMLDRVVVNLTPDDAWLAPAERELVACATSSALELACHWVLKEAYGKALGVGLALSLADLAFVGQENCIAIDDRTADRGEGWDFRLYWYDPLVIGVAHRTGFRP